MKIFGLILFAMMLLLVSACGKQGSQQNAPAAVAPMPEMARMSAPQAKMMPDSVGGAEESLTEISEPKPIAPANAETRKYIALRHHLQIETPAERMQAAFDEAVKHCEALNCQLLSVRVPPRNVEIFLSGLAKSGEIMQHGRDSEDKTNQVVDADARIKNLTELRDRLRIMLTDKSAKFKDIIDVERELANTQSELDGMMSMRKILSQETDLVAVNIDFIAAQGITEQGFFAPVARALKDAGRVMMESFGAVITFVMSAIPWLLIGIPVLWLVRRYWAKIKTKLM